MILNEREQKQANIQRPYIHDYENRKWEGHAKKHT